MAQRRSPPVEERLVENNPAGKTTLIFYLSLFSSVHPFETFKNFISTEISVGGQ